MTPASVVAALKSLKDSGDCPESFSPIYSAGAKPAHFFQHLSTDNGTPRHNAVCVDSRPSQISTIIPSLLLMTGSRPSLFPQSQNKRVPRASGTPKGPVSCWGQPCAPVGENGDPEDAEKLGVLRASVR